MKIQILTGTALAAVITSIAFAADETNPIKDAMRFAHKAPKGEKKLSEKIIDGTAPEADVEKALGLYKAMADTKPPKGDQADFKAKVAKLIAATEEVIAKKPDAAAHYKAAVDCKACHSEHKADPPKPWFRPAIPWKRGAAQGSAPFPARQESGNQPLRTSLKRHRTCKHRRL